MHIRENQHVNREAKNEETHKKDKPHGLSLLSDDVINRPEEEQCVIPI